LPLRFFSRRRLPLPLLLLLLLLLLLRLRLRLLPLLLRLLREAERPLGRSEGRSRRGERAHLRGGERERRRGGERERTSSRAGLRRLSSCRLLSGRRSSGRRSSGSWKPPPEEGPAAARPDGGAGRPTGARRLYSVRSLLPPSVLTASHARTAASSWTKSTKPALAMLFCGSRWTFAKAPYLAPAGVGGVRRETAAGAGAASRAAVGAGGVPAAGGLMAGGWRRRGWGAAHCEKWLPTSASPIASGMLTT
jgi:hypothetical protein